MSEFVSKYKWILISVSGILLLVGSFILGRYTVVPKTNIEYVEKQVVVEKEVVKIVEVTKTIVERVHDSVTEKRVHKERTEETRPDGTKIVRETEDINVEKVVKDVDVKYVDRTNTVEKQVDKEVKVEVIKIVKTPLPDWELAAKVGVNINNLLNPTLGSPVVVGAEIDRRIIGPFKAGVWVTTNTTFNNWQAGLSVNGEF
jgi:hypothetical protein